MVGIEHIEELVQMSIKNVQADDPELLTSGRIKLVGESGCVRVMLPFKFKCCTVIKDYKSHTSLSTVGDGRLGFPDGAPYDAIHVGAAAATIPKAVRTFAFTLVKIE